MNVAKLIDDNILIIDDMNAPKPSIRSHADTNGKTFRFGQVHIDKLVGIGRKLLVRFEKDINKEDEEIIFNFETE